MSKKSEGIITTRCFLIKSVEKKFGGKLAKIHYICQKKTPKKVIFQTPTSLASIHQIFDRQGGGRERFSRRGGMGEAKNEPPAAPSPLALHVGKII